ncbi:hypothetical protein Tco_0416168, partial [Tanacetum coccineum]
MQKNTKITKIDFSSFHRQINPCYPRHHEPRGSDTTLNGIEEDDWSIEIDADHVDLGQDGLGVFDWSEEADNAPVALALMATSSTDSSNSE